jgi:universal stress protein E
MRPVRRILVAVKEPGARSQPAVAKAAQLARAFGAKIELFHAIASPVFMDTLAAQHLDLADLQREQREAMTAQLERVAARLRRHKVEVATCVEWDYPIYEAIVRRATAIGAGLIVAERHGGARHAKWLLSFTDFELLRLAACPVLIVKTSRLYHRPTVLAAIDPTHAYAKPARLDDQILGAGARLTEALHGELHAMYAYLPMPVMPIGMTGNGYAVAAQLEAGATRAAQNVFERALRKQSIGARQRHIVHGHPVDAIPATARAARASLVIMGAVSRSGLKRLFIGNTAEQVLDALPCDVLVVKPLRFRTRVAASRRGVRLLATPIVP